MASDVSRVAASDLARAAYCPRQLYYARREDDRSPPAEVAETRALAFRYRALRTATDETLRSLPIEVSPAEYRANLDALAERDDWDALADPPARDVLLTGKDCRGVAAKVLPGGGEAGVADDTEERDEVATADGVVDAGDDHSETTPPPVPTLVAAGVPAESGVWEPQAMRAVAVAKMLAWEHEREVPAALVEYPAVGVVRPVRVTVRRAARYRELLRTARAIDGPPPRISDGTKCDACDYRAECGVRTQSLRSLLGL